MDNGGFIAALVIAVIGSVPGIVQAIYAALSYHRPNAGTGAVVYDPAGLLSEPKRPSSRRFWIMAAFPLLAWAAVGFDYYDRGRSSNEQLALLQSVLDYGSINEDSFYMTVDGDKLQNYAINYMAVLICRTSFLDIDKMTDKNIAKSKAYTIVPGQFDLAIPHVRLHFIPNQSNDIAYYLVVLPVQYSPDQITTIGDVGKLGGKVLVTKGRTEYMGVRDRLPQPPPNL